jgi:hypothetical protein
VFSLLSIIFHFSARLLAWLCFWFKFLRTWQRRPAGPRRVPVH